MAKSSTKTLKPIMKWAGGKAQMLKDIIPKIPEYKGKYIEPFFGGGALFFALRPDNAVIADSNPELINMYVQVATNVDAVIEKLKTYENTEEMFYEIRALDWETLPQSEAAARTIYLNKTCFNGLYRVNQKGQFNTPFGKYKNPTICDEDLLRSVSELLKKANIICGDYLDVLMEYAAPGDFANSLLAMSKDNHSFYMTKCKRIIGSKPYYRGRHQKLSDYLFLSFNLVTHVILYIY